VVGANEEDWVSGVADLVGIGAQTRFELSCRFPACFWGGANMYAVVYAVHSWHLQEVALVLLYVCASWGGGRGRRQ
jgi:hypothetical protein